MKTVDFLRKHDACISGSRWALSISSDMADVWEAMIKQNRHDWLLWAAIRPGVFHGAVMRKLACRFVRETPLSDGRMVWDLLTDDRSRRAIEVAEAFANGKATESELSAAYAAAYSAACDAYSAARDAANAAARAALAAACVAAEAAACAAAPAGANAAANAANAAAYAAARAATYTANAAAAKYTVDAAYAAAKAAQAQMIAELGNPFKERTGR